MDSEALLARENEFKKLNKQLEKKTELLMKQIEQVMQKQDIFSEFSGSLSKPKDRHTKTHCCDIPEVTTPEKFEAPKKVNKKQIGNTKQSDYSETPVKNPIETNANLKCATNVCEWCNLSSKVKRNNDLDFLYAFVSVNVKENVLPQSFLKDQITVENVCKFLSAKVKLMQEQIDQLQVTINKMSKQCDSHMNQLAGLESERMSLINKANNLRSESVDVKAKYAALTNRYNEKDRLHREQRSSADRLSTEIKSLRCRNANLEARCAAQDESLAALKQQLETARLSEKDFRDATRNLSASHQNAICRLEAKVKCLSTRIEKQEALIDNLKKQNALLATEGALKALEKDYNELLNSDFQ
ncbi:unnamed protein product [Leptosia nina]|uniref:Testis-expressed sequence 9 protein n=1 Tax=Leptosia nina TaxID=320188 RepID=A0AAV1JK52_9NEOP